MPLRTDGSALRERRTLKGLTIAELAQLMQYSENHVGQVELGHENAGPQFLRKAAEILDCEISDITNGVIPRKRSVTTRAEDATPPVRAVA
jgi:transcriptional regulator with XRE-family HTH domain